MRPSHPSPRILRTRHGARRVLAAAGAATLVLAPASAALAEDAAPEAPATQPAAPEILLPAEDQVDQVAEPEAEPAPEAEAEPAPEVEPAAEADPVPEPDASTVAPAAVAEDPAGAEAGLQAAAPLPEGYYGNRKVYPSVVAAEAEDPTPDLTATFTVEHWDGDTLLSTETIQTSPDGSFNGPFGFAQAAEEQLEFTLTTAPEGFMLPADVTEFVDYCVVPVADTSCANESFAVTVVRDYRTVGVAAATPAGTPVAGVTVELHSPLAEPEPTPDPTASPTSEPTLAATDDLAPVVIPNRTLIATGVTDGAGGIVFDETVPPAEGYLVVPTDVPDGYYLPDPVTADIGAVDTVAEADTMLAVPVVVVPVPVAPPTPPAPGPGTSVGGRYLPATGATSGALAGLAVVLMVTGAGAVVGARRLEARA